MNDERFLRDWLQDTTDDTSDPQASADRLLARVPEIKQRSRWWPWLPGRRRPDDDRPPSPQGRTRFMLSPVKAITAGALALALSAAFLIAQPPDRLGDGVPGAEQGAGPEPPVEVTATHLRIVGCETPDPEMDGYAGRVYGEICTIENEWSDPRLQGTETYHANSVEYADSRGLSIGRYVHNIVTDDGAWRMRPQFRIGSYYPGPDNFEGVWVLDGEDAYEGLSVVLAKEGNDLSGFIVSTEMVPPPPEEGSTK